MRDNKEFEKEVLKKILPFVEKSIADKAPCFTVDSSFVLGCVESVIEKMTETLPEISDAVVAEEIHSRNDELSDAVTLAQSLMK